MNKTILLAGVIVFSLLACKQKNSNGAFEVSGKIKGVKKQLVYLQQFPFEGTQLQIVDSATLGNDGSYKLHTIGKEEGLYTVGVATGPQAIFVNDNDDITINLDSVNFRHPYIQKAPPQPQAFTAFMDNYVSRKILLPASLMQQANLTNGNGRLGKTGVSAAI